MNKILIAIFIFASSMAISYEPALADGIIIPDPPICDSCPNPLPLSQLSIRYHHVTVSIKDQIATTHVDQVFFNPNEWEIEGDYVFPIPKGATISNFVLWIDGIPVEGEILDAEKARQTYEEIVSTMRDPALLEYSEQDAVRARIFPIPSKGERRIELQYSQTLTAENGLVQYIYPLGTEKFSIDPLESVSITVDILSKQPIRAIYSPSHKISVSRESNFSIIAGYEEQDVLPDQDFSLIYSIGESEAFHLLSFRDPTDFNDPDGFFLLLLAPALQESTRPIPKDVVIVVDQSGSMEGEKFEQAQQAMRYILNQLNSQDRFNIIAFSTGVDLYAQYLMPASEIDEAISWVNRLSAGGSTDINRALLEAASLVEDTRTSYLIFLTDGLPTVGEVESEKIISNMLNFAPENLSLFAFGVGYDVDTYLLDSLAQNHHGTSTYVVPGEALDESLSAFYNKISTPVLTNLNIDFGDLKTKDIYPHPLPDLFAGSQIAVVGRYAQGGIVDVTLSGSVNGSNKDFIYPAQVFEQKSEYFGDPASQIPSLWATRKIGYLLQQIRLNGPDREIIDEIVQLSIRYGIVTPYTSYLVTESSVLGMEEQERIVSEELQKFNDLATLPTFGRGAVEQAEGQNSLAQADSAPAAPYEAHQKVRTIGSRTFIDSNGVWTDTRFDPQQMETIEIAFLSEQYFSLARNHPELAMVFALGSEVIVISGDKTYEIINEGFADIPSPVPTPHVSTQATPAVSTPEQVHSETNPPKPSVVPTLPCMSGLVFALLPMIAVGAVRFRRK
ncbi:MAG: VIT domain-containing protein [Anaerolineales bacterium]